MADRTRVLEELRVIDLRGELEKRNLDKSGVRGVLLQRLTKYLEEQGHDPATYKFELSATESKTPTKKTRRTESTKEPESEETPAMEDMIVQDTAGDEEDIEHSDRDNISKEAETKSEEKMEIDSNNKCNRKRETKDISDITPPKKQCLEKDIKQEEDHKGENNTDAEDSINLDIGDDELLNEETDNSSKINNDKKNDSTDSSTGAASTAQPDHWNDVDDEAQEDQPVEGSSDPVPDPDGETADAASTENQVTNEATATSNETDNNEKDSKVKDDKENGETDKKEKKDDCKEGGARNLWVSGLSSDTRAKDLKQLCSKHGKVIGAKIVTNARTPGSRCYGYVTMASAQDAENCIKNLHRTELHGRMISVEKAKSESESSTRKQPAPRPERRPSKERKEESTANEENKDGEKNMEQKLKKDGEVSGEEGERSPSARDKQSRPDKDRGRRSTKSRDRRRSPREVLSFSKIWKERDVARARERSRAAREEERRRRAAEDALRERERRQRQEKHRLALEREKLRAEREKIEREKNELLRLERERHRLEREKLELERLELKRAQLRLEEERRKRGYEGGAYRKAAASPPPEPAYERERHKRAPPPPMSSSRGQFEAPPPPRFELASSYDRGGDKRDRDYKREYPRHVTSSNLKYPSNGNTNEDTRQPMPPGTRPKEPSRSYDSREARSYRSSPPGKPEPRNWNTSNRYPDTTQPKGNSGNSSEPWTGGEPRYASASGASGYETRYGYQPPPPGATPYPDRYAPNAREYARKY